MAVAEVPRKAEDFLRLNLVQLGLLGLWKIHPVLRIFTTTLILCMTGLLVGDLRLIYLAGSDLQVLSKAVSFLMAHGMSFAKWILLFSSRRTLEGIVDDLNTCIDLGFQAKRGNEHAAMEVCFQPSGVDGVGQMARVLAHGNCCSRRWVSFERPLSFVGRERHLCDTHRTQVYNKNLFGRWRLAKWMNSFWFLMLSYAMIHWCISVLSLRIPMSSSNSTNVTEFGRVFPVGDWQIIDSRYSPGYESIYLTQSFAVLGHAWTHGTFDGLYITLGIFLCGCLEFMADIMLEVGDTPENFEDIGAAIRFHQALLRVAKDVDKLFSFIMLMQMLNLVLVLCTFAFQASTVDENGETNLVSALQVVSCGVFQLLMFCSVGSNMTSMSYKVAESAYASHWIDKPLPWKRCIQLVIHRAQIPLRLTGGAFYLICLETFVAILQLSFSYFMVLRTLNENNQGTH